MRSKVDRFDKRINELGFFTQSSWIVNQDIAFLRLVI
jgi:hypothetical protein